MAEEESLQQPGHEITAHHRRMRKIKETPDSTSAVQIYGHKL